MHTIIRTTRHAGSGAYKVVRSDGLTFLVENVTSHNSDGHKQWNISRPGQPAFDAADTLATAKNLICHFDDSVPPGRPLIDILD